MALNSPKSWLVCYDIADPRRLARLHRFLRKRAVPLQYSVFCFDGSAAQLGRLVGDIESRIDECVDDVRIYQMPDRPVCDTLGRGSVPGDVLLLSARQPGLERLTGAAARRQPLI